jgi:hypothetical protein
MGIDLLDRPVVDLVGLPIGRADAVETVPGLEGTPERCAVLHTAAGEPVEIYS